MARAWTIVALLMLAVTVVAQTTTQAATPANATAVTETIQKWASAVISFVRLLFAVGFWVAVAILIYHVLLAQLAPTRFQRMSSLWDALERAKDILFAWGKLFLLIYAIYVGIGILTNQTTMNPVDVFKWLAVDPITQLFNPIK